jgi:hypothetical protein
MLFASLKIELIVDILIWHILEVTRLVPLLGNTSNYVHAGKRIRQVQQSQTKKQHRLCRATAVVAFVRCAIMARMNQTMKNQALAAIIKTERERRNLTQEHLA